MENSDFLIKKLHKIKNNEAVDEDNKINRQVINRLKKQVELFYKKDFQPIELSESILNNLEKFIINFDDNLNKTLNDIYKKGETKEDTGDLVLNYNLLSNYLDKINFNLMKTDDKNKIYVLLDELTNKIGKILSLIKLKEYTDSDLVEKIFNNFKNRTYNIILSTDREPVSKLSGDNILDIKDAQTKEETINRLNNIIFKANEISKVKKLPKNSVITKSLNQAKTLLKALKNNTVDLFTLNKFLKDKENKINEEYFFINKDEGELQDEEEAEEATIDEV